jgi:hypothetical protein
MAWSGIGSECQPAVACLAFHDVVTAAAFGVFVMPMLHVVFQ